MKTPKEIKEFLNNKVLANINFTTKEIISGNTPKVETISIDDFLKWFESKPKEENQDIITFDGKEYEFIESDCLSCCNNCDFAEAGCCTLSPFREDRLRCVSIQRRDRKEGYFKLIKQKNLELIPNEFYYLKRDNYSWVIQFKEFIDGDYSPICYYYMLGIQNNTLNSNFKCVNNGWIKATPAQKQLLIDRVQEVTDKTWNEDTKMFEDKPKDILVPENIKIVKGCDGKLGLLFNERKQVITSFNVSDTIFDLNSFDTLFHKIIPCKLVPVHDDDIKIGEIFFCCKIEYVNTDESVNYTDLANITDQRHYVIKVTDENGVSIQDEGCSIRIHGIDTGAVVYKVIPIK